MAIKTYMESSLSTSEIFKGLNASSDASNEGTTQKAINLAKTAKRLTNEDIEAAYISVKQINDSLTRAALKAYDEEQTILLYNNVPALSVTQALPFITFGFKNGKYVTYVFMDKYIQVTRENEMKLSAPILRDLLTGAVISNGLKRNYDLLASNQYLHTILMEIYTQLVIRVLNRQFSIIADKQVYDLLQYCINRFFLMRVLGANDAPENLERLAAKHFKYIDELTYADIKKKYDEQEPATIPELLEFIKPLSPRMKNLNMSSFMGAWVVYYYAPSLLALDTIEYFIFMVLTLLSGNNIISIAGSDIVKETKNIKGLKGELLKLI